jgi:hypothetical protein
VPAAIMSMVRTAVSAASHPRLPTCGHARSAARSLLESRRR